MDVFLFVLFSCKFDDQYSPNFPRFIIYTYVDNIENVETTPSENVGAFNAHL